MPSKRNAALSAIGAAPRTASEPTVDTVTTLRPPKPSKGVAKVMVYMPAKVARKFKEMAFTEERKANDVYLDALDLYLRQQGHGGLKAVAER
jgi:hypothetical protein